MDDDYRLTMDMEPMEVDDEISTNLSSINESIKTLENKSGFGDGNRFYMDESFVRKSSSNLKTSTTPERHCLQNLNENLTSYQNVPTGSIKKPNPPVLSPIQSKRYKSENDPPAGPMQYPLPQSHPNRPKLGKSPLIDSSLIDHALSQPISESNLIGDFSRTHCLPLVPGRHHDLKSISAETMKKLLNGEFNDRVATYKVIDCRYPYEFEGGHIRGALNLYTEEQILNELFGAQKSDEQKGIILVFHCEFSSKRGPKLSRFLRRHDRKTNNYPSLRYPEIYLLHNGYKEFFETNADLCDPIAYRSMVDPQYSAQYRHFRAKTNAWSGGIGSSANNRLMKSRSRLVL